MSASSGWRQLTFYCERNPSTLAVIGGNSPTDLRGGGQQNFC